MNVSGAVVVVGLGLLGGSVARTLAAGGHRVVGVDPSPATRAAARACGIAAVADATGIAGASGPGGGPVGAPSVVVLAVPLRAMGTAAAAVAPLVGAGTVLTDVGSVKAAVRAAVDAAGLGERYVGAHPMAGTERSGFEASSADLLPGARWAVTVAPGTRPDALATVLDLVTGPLGGTVTLLDDAAHDRAVALVSHVPHVLATELLGLVARSGSAGPALALAAGSFRDGTRVARTDPRRTEAMVVQNASAVAPLLREAADALSALAQRLERGAAVAGFFDAPDPVREALDRGSVVPGPRAGTPPGRELLGAPGWRERLLGAGAAGAVVVGVEEGPAGTTVLQHVRA
ncbi:prephenate dehydrogenase/arogenate dehydrogenase family protein [Cellulomonas sp. PhB143]|uniref:prephenate dehydrogenase n=1 Tax=Cellulomonas sp. PhB143 TaxID=2485186 RepID=UPI000F4601DD|nr:prephenate dehydrogenase/arogenate dehydrogenase family protein [Cellulomonas sp. PhB143]ROS76928.1 prephenate dehydrogenase [Cellulomonas sp. PhB143]